MKRREGTTSLGRIAPQRGEGGLAGGERSEPPDRRGITICAPAGVAGAPRAPAGARWSRRHGFQGFAKGAHPWLRARAEINSHFGASAGRADARRRDEGDVGHRRGAATKPIRALRRRAPAGCGPQARRLCCSLLTYRPGYSSSLAPRQRAWGPGAKCEVISARALRRGGAEPADDRLVRRVLGAVPASSTDVRQAGRRSGVLFPLPAWAERLPKDETPFGLIYIHYLQDRVVVVLQLLFGKPASG